MKDQIKELEQYTQKYEKEIREISDFIYNNPELGYEEFKASKRIADYIESKGFKVERGIAGVETAIRARFENEPGKDTPCVCIPCEYDALAGMGHACGHNLITACSLTAALAAADYAKAHRIPLRLCFMGTPAEESKGGKVRMLKGGAFEGIDMAVMSHPGRNTITDAGALGVARALISFHGKASHGATPEKGINALDSMVYFYSDMLRWKATDLEARERVHGIITKGGDAPNIIPDFTQAYFYVRAPNPEGLEKLKAKMEQSAKIGAEKTGCRYTVDWISAYKPIKFNQALSVRYQKIWKDMGEEIPLLTGCEDCSSTDMGDVTQVMPGAHFHFNIFEGEKSAGHSIGFRAAAGTDFGFRMAQRAGVSLAALVLDYTTDPELRKNVIRDFKNNR